MTNQRQIFKYPVPIDDEWHEIPNRLNSHLHVGIQGRTVMVWTSPNEEDAPGPLMMWAKVVGTGEPFPMDAGYVGTVQDPPFVWHVICLEEKPE